MNFSGSNRGAGHPINKPHSSPIGRKADMIVPTVDNLEARHPINKPQTCVAKVGMEQENPSTKIINYVCYTNITGNYFSL